MMDNIRTYAELRDFGRRISVAITRHSLKDNGDTSVELGKIEWVPFAQSAVLTGNEALELTPAQAQDLMDQLWRAGCRPASTQIAEGKMQAMTEHLADLRKLVFASKNGSI